MCVGVVSGFACVKFSTSPISRGIDVTVIITMVAKITEIWVSLFIKLGLNFIFSMSSFVPVGFEEPVEWSVAR